jgi:hypothetical protein
MVLLESTKLLMSGAVAFIAAAAKRLPSSDVWCILYPSLKHFLRSDIREVDEKSLLIAMKPHVCNKKPDVSSILTSIDSYRGISLKPPLIGQRKQTSRRSGAAIVLQGLNRLEQALRPSSRLEMGVPSLTSECLG